MPSYRAESLIKTMILSRCRRQRMGLAVCSATMFAATVASILAKVRNAEKDPQPVTAGGPVLRVLRVSVRKRSGRGELDLGPGRDRLLRRAGDELSVTSHSSRDRLERNHDTLQVEHDAGSRGCCSESEQTDHLRWYYLECPQSAVDDVQSGEDAQDDEHRLTRAWRGGLVDVAHDPSPPVASSIVPSALRNAAS